MLSPLAWARDLVTRHTRPRNRYLRHEAPSGSSLVVSADLSTLPSRKRSSQRTQRWREMDSNHRYRIRKQPFLAAPVRPRNLPSATKLELTRFRGRFVA